MTFDVDDLVGLGLSPRSIYLYGRMIARAEEVFTARGTDLATCRPLDVAAVAEAIGPSYSLRCRLRAALRAAWTVTERLDGPLRAVRVPPKPKSRCKALEPIAATRLEQAAWDHPGPEGTAVLLGLYAGLRRFEIARLRWEHIDVDEHGLPTWLRIWGKGDVVADVPVHPVLAERLEAERRRKGWVFPGRDRARPVSPNTIWQWSLDVAAGAGLARVPTHVLRHTALAECNDRSGDLRTVQEIARHSRPETTAGYTRTTAARMRSVISMIDYGRRAS